MLGDVNARAWRLLTRWLRVASVVALAAVILAGLRGHNLPPTGRLSWLYPAGLLVWGIALVADYGRQRAERSKSASPSGPIDTPPTHGP
jgi:hypothetical protein